MKLLQSPFSPFARKVVACATARGIAGQLTEVPVSGEHPDLVAHNPLGKLPCLITDDGVALFDSRVICEYLDTIGDAFPMFPAHANRFRALRLQALGDGICDAAVLRRAQQGRPAEPHRDAAMEVQRTKIIRSLAVLEAEPPAEHVDIGSIAVACALGYLDLRFAEEPWRESYPKLAAWFTVIMRQPCLAQTAP